MTDMREWRVRWRRDGGQIHRKLFQTEVAARNLVSLLEGSPVRGWDEDPDSGYNPKDYWDEAPKVVFLTIERRPVGAWASAAPEETK